MAKYKKRKDGRYATTVSTGVYKPDGRQVIKTVYGRTIAEVDAKVAAARAGTLIGRDRSLFKDYAADYIKTYKHGLADKTLEKYRWILSGCSILNSLPVQHITKAVIMSEINAHDGHPDVQRLILMLCREIMRQAVDDGILNRSPADGIRLRQHKAAEKRPLTDAEAEAIRSISWTDKQRAFLTVLYSFGLRLGECLALTKDDVTADGIRVNKALQYLPVTLIKPPKTAAGYRTVQGSQTAIERLKEYGRTVEGDYLFSASDGRTMSHATYRRFWSGIRSEIEARAGRQSPRLSPHIFRHNYATLLYRAGVDAKTAQRQLGHSSIAVTLGIYTHLSAGSDDKLKSIGF